MKNLLTEWRKYVLTEGMKTAANLPPGSAIAIKSRGTNPMFVYTYGGKPLYDKPNPRFNPGVPEGAPWGEVLIGKLKPKQQKKIGILIVFISLEMENTKFFLPMKMQSQ